MSSIWPRCFVYALFVAFVVAWTLPSLATLSRRDKVIITIAIVIYCSICFAFGGLKQHTVIASCIILCLTAAGLIALTTIGVHVDESLSAKRTVILKTFLLAMALVGTASNLYFRFAPSEGAYIKQFVRWGSTVNLMTNNSGAAAADMGDNSFYRLISRRLIKTTIATALR